MAIYPFYTLIMSKAALQVTSGKKRKHMHNIHLLLYMHDKEFDEERVIFLGGNIVTINFRM